MSAAAGCRSAPDPGDPRRSLYRAADIAALAQRKARGRKASDVAAGAIAWGEPVLASAITTVAGGRLFYRGRDADPTGRDRDARGRGPPAARRPRRGAQARRPPRAARPSRTCAPGPIWRLAVRAGSDPPARGRDALALAVEAATLLDVLADAVAGYVGGGAIHNRLALAWGLGPAAPAPT